MESHEFLCKNPSFLLAEGRSSVARILRTTLPAVALAVALCWTWTPAFAAVIPTHGLEAASLSGSLAVAAVVDGLEVPRVLPWHFRSQDTVVPGMAKSSSESVRIAYESPYVRQQRSRWSWRTNPFTRQQRATPIDIPTYGGSYPYDQGPLRDPDWVTDTRRKR
jgi:hypothetical protein